MASTHARLEQADALVARYSWGNAAVGLLPLPVFDLVAITGVQLAMVYSISKSMRWNFAGIWRGDW